MRQTMIVKCWASVGQVFGLTYEWARSSTHDDLQNSSLLRQQQGDLQSSPCFANRATYKARACFAGRVSFAKQGSLADAFMIDKVCR